ncbi:hypothetical protein B2J86_12480 [Acidovorax sp. SRB_14]|uniref:hypothetical protein n=1 Tax=unclassified Acidovorax TaxID=2684926 RepID=UPI00145E4324|nr:MULTISPECIES: hypothetical protein [unclassified Acidovorax]NMM76122.1 hypothetical protein [Acidovorax sp. SRB_24]NMM81727.1 hypothetical protein [Acidovorax sp. SRB_14]NMM86466.1 hypothetical protein [Rhodococcus sp. SRB_17]
MTLRYLDFDYSEDGEGTGTWDAMASVLPAQLNDLLAEVAQVLDWAHRDFAGQRGPIEEGADWDYDLQCVQEVVTPQELSYDEATRQITAHCGAPGAPRYTLTLSLCGRKVFGETLRQRFGLD